MATYKGFWKSNHKQCQIGISNADFTKLQMYVSSWLHTLR